jgi:hypothetical protein
MRKPPEKPTSLRPQGEKITLPKPTLIIDSMEQKPFQILNLDLKTKTISFQR